MYLYVSLPYGCTTHPCMTGSIYIIQTERTVVLSKSMWNRIGIVKCDWNTHYKISILFYTVII